jgi:hypothetical protein
MKTFLVFLVGVGAAIGWAAHAAADDSFRCDSGRLVSRGDHMLAVQKRCGDPDFASQRTEKRKVTVKQRRWVRGYFEQVEEEHEIEVLLEEWSYDLGPSRFVRFVLFEDARVVSVRMGDYGSKS